MSPTIEKLRHLWKNRSTVLGEKSNLNKRVKRIYEIVGAWDGDVLAIQALSSSSTPEDLEIPVADWPTVRTSMLEFYEGDEHLRTYKSQVNEVEELLVVANRKNGTFRISSNAKTTSHYDTWNTTPVQLNPESFYASYNFPFEIIKYYLALKTTPSKTPELRECLDERFLRKFLWMLANREEVVPIFSLASFYALAPRFLDIQKDVDWGGEANWALSLGNFIEPWKRVSADLSKQIIGREYATLTSEERKSFAELLFIASLSETTTKNALDMVKTGNHAMILYGPPGTGKTFQAKKVARELLGLSEDADGASKFDSCNFSSDPADSLPGCWELIQFHPNYSYQDFMGGIMPKLTGESLGYEKKEGIFKRFCYQASLEKNSKKPFILIIDEINRADLSSVFGELMYALEYRNKVVSVLHFGSFTIPSNVYVIGTMNSSDKSLVTFDLALRRRFLFFKLLPDMTVLNDWNVKLKISIDGDDIDLLIQRARTLNNAIISKNTADALNLPEDYGIGPAYFMKVIDFCVQDSEVSPRLRITEFSREQLWTYHLEPLLEEYLGAELESKKKSITSLRDKFIADSNK